MSASGERPRRRPMEIAYDAEVDAAYLPLTDIAPGEAVRQVFVQDVPAPADIILDFNADGRLLGIEIIGAMAVLGPTVLGLSEPTE